MAVWCTTLPVAMHHLCGSSAPFRRWRCTIIRGQAALLGRHMQDGAILIHRDSSFSFDEMNELLNSLGIAAKLTEGLDSDPQIAIEQLEKQIQLLQEGE